jgi:basic amino acid/polyamine antiporter, APA family
MQPEQRRSMGLAATIALVVGESIALGIFLTPAAMAKSLGSPLLLAAVWCVMGAVALFRRLFFSKAVDVTLPITVTECPLC